MKRKGISLAVETVIIIILAAAVLTALLFFFRSVWGPTQDDIDRLNRRTTLCQKYLALDPTCRQSEYSANSDLQETARSLKELCVKEPAFEPFCKTNQPRGLPQGMPADFYCVTKCCASYGCAGAP